jgi:hypothetical protein
MDAREFLDTTPQLWVSQHIVRLHLLARDTMEVEDLDNGAGETALGFCRCALHEQHDGVRLDSLFKLGPGLC